ncbi:precorrin-6A reductase [Anaerovibrio sp.]|uniref:precorrin-6A reductase n=1 Tax=Anaerovibrio sp. TaxID=1872532 RepID=UPI003F176DAE
MAGRIFVAAGTQDGRELAGYILQRGYQVTASVVSSYGESLLRSYQGLQVSCEALDAEGFMAYFRQHGVSVFVDASHPYAANVSENAMQACHGSGVAYIRYERQQTPLDYDKAYYVADYQRAAEKAAELGKRIFLTTGSRRLEVFARSPAMKGREMVCRILPEPEVVQLARELGFTPASIIAMQGPFSLELNKELYRKYGAQVVVTKNSGAAGGADTKFAAAMELGLPLVIIDRPAMRYDNIAYTFEAVVDFIALQ